MYKKVLRNLSYGVYVVTSKDNDKKVGCIINSAMQVTSNNTTIAVSINRDTVQKYFICSICDQPHT